MWKWPVGSPFSSSSAPQGFDALLQKTNATWDELTSPDLNETLAGIVGLHVIPGQRLFPLSSLREGTELLTANGGKLYMRRE